MSTQRYLPFVLFALIIFLQLRRSLSTWNLSSVGLTDDVPIWRFAVWRNRAFLAIPSYLRDTWSANLRIEITLLEAGWPEPGNNFTIGVASNSAVQIFPKSSRDIADECRRLLSVTGLDVDVRGRLWVLDSPVDTDCPAKILVYDLRRNDHEIVRTDLHGISKNNLKCLAVDPHVGIWGPRAYVGDPGDESIIVYSLKQRRWWRLRLLHGASVPRLRSTEMAMSRKSPLLYITGAHSQDLFSVDLEESRIDEGPLRANSHSEDATKNATVKWLGSKMGSSSGMICDQRGGLHYFLVTEHASVRWDTKHDLKTSSHAILLQSEDVPCITDYSVDSQRNVWGLVNQEHPFANGPGTRFVREWSAKFRTIRIYKYNPFVP